MLIGFVFLIVFHAVGIISVVKLVERTIDLIFAIALCLIGIGIERATTPDKYTRIENRMTGCDPTEIREWHSETDLQELNTRLGTTKNAEEKQESAHKEIQRLYLALDLDQRNIDRAYRMYNNIIQTSIVQNHSVSELAAGIVYTICRDEQKPRGLSDIDSICSIQPASNEWGRYSIRTRTVISRVHTRICDHLDLTFVEDYPERFLDRYIQNLDIEQEVEDIAKVALRKTIDNKDTIGSSPTFAAGALYYAMQRSDSDKSRSDLSNVSNLNGSTIRQKKQEIEQILEDRRPSPGTPWNPGVMDHLIRYCRFLNISKDVEETARIVVEKTENPHPSNKYTTRYAAGALYFAAEYVGANASKRELSNTVGTSVEIIEEYQDNIQNQLDI